MILGLTGTYGSGKSTVARMLAERGAFVIDADAIARQVVEPDQPAFLELRRTFGEGIVGTDGRLDRAAMASIVFSHPDQRRRLESIVHPRVRERELVLLQANRHLPLVVLDVPLLFENRLDLECDATCVVVLSEAEREQRLLQRDHASPDSIRRRLAAQLPQDEKIRRSDYQIDNSSSLEATRFQVDALIQKLIPPQGA